jgi:pSer/pThr/pTyr-binding forkhead associated (FHA) protein
MFKSLPVFIGRAYSNDLILSDAYVCPTHAQINQTEDGWRIEDHESNNGVYIKNRKETVSTSAPLNSGDLLVLGRTHLRIFSPTHPVSESKSIQIPKQRHVQWSVPLLAWSLTLLSILLIMLDFYLDMGDENLSEELLQAAIAVLIFMGLVFIWSAGWSFIGRVLKNKTHFHYHLLTVATGLVIIEICIYANNFIGYNTCNTELRDLAGILLPIAIIGSLFALSVRAATRLPKVHIHLISAFIALLFASVFIFAELNNQSEFNDSPEFDAVLFTPGAQIVRGETIEQFMQANEKLFQKLHQ